MRRRITVFLVVFLLIFFTFSSCKVIQNLTNKIPQNYSEGINFSKDYEENALEIYDDAIVYDELTAFGEAIIFCGSEDDFEDIVDFYKEFFEDNEISLLEEVQERDEYYARGSFEGYEFKVSIKEPGGEYEEGLYENVIVLMTREIQEGEDLSVDNKLEVTPEPSLDNTTQPTQESGETSIPSDNIERPDADEYETRLNQALSTGAWVMSYDSYVDDSFWEWVMYLDDDSSGRMYYIDYPYNDRWWDDFTYTIDDGVITIDFPNGDSYSYFAYLDYETLHLFDYNDFEVEFYFYNYGQYSVTDSFYAYGDWFVFHTDEKFIGTVAFWPDGTGYIYNWYSNEEDIAFTWENIDGTIYYYEENGELLDSFTWLQKYSILEYQSQARDIDLYFYSRTDLNLLQGTYELTDTNEDGLYSWNMIFNDDYTASMVLESSEGTYEDDAVSWYINSADGKIYLYMNEEYFGFNYHHYESGLILYDDEYGYMYDLTKVE